MGKTLSEAEEMQSARRAEFGRTGRGYIEIQSTKVGSVIDKFVKLYLLLLALYDRNCCRFITPGDSCVHRGEISRLVRSQLLGHK